MSDRVFTDRGTWLGADFELALRFEIGSDVSLSAALSALWRHSDLEGCYLESEREPADQERVGPESIESGSRYFGIARLPNGKRVACSSFILRGDDGADELVFGIPMGSLGSAYRVGGYPFGKQGERAGPWLREVETWLVGIGRHVASSVPFDLGMIGHDVCGELSSENVDLEGIPTDRYVGYLVPEGATLAHFPITH
jgi:hypothetical protein